MVSPSPMTNSPTVVMSLPMTRTGVRSTAMSGPAIARSAPFSSRVTHGTTAP